MQRHHAVLVADSGQAREGVVDVRKLELRGWIFVAVGLLIPFMAAAGVATGWELLRAGARQRGWALIAAGLVAFVGRLALFLS